MTHFRFSFVYINEWKAVKATSSRRRLESARRSILSDRRAKENIRTIENALGALNQIRGVRFTYDDIAGTGGQGVNIGVIAQEVQAVLPELVETDDTGLLRVDYSAMTGYLVQVNKELHQEVASLREEVDSLRFLVVGSVLVSLVGMVAAVGLFAFLARNNKK